MVGSIFSVKSWMQEGKKDCVAGQWRRHRIKFHWSWKHSAKSSLIWMQATLIKPVNLCYSSTLYLLNLHLILDIIYWSCWTDLIYSTLYSCYSLIFLDFFVFFLSFPLCAIFWVVGAFAARNFDNPQHGLVTIFLE